MADNETAALPEGTDTVIEGAAKTTEGGAATVEDTALVMEKEIPAQRPQSGGSTTTAEGGSTIVDRFRTSADQLSGQAGEKARSIVTQGLERTSEALANVARMVGDTAPGIEERLGGDYADYARRAAGSIENVANTIASKDPDELIEDTRNFVRNSPGIALAGAAVVGFVVARLFKTGIAATRNEDEDEGD